MTEEPFLAFTPHSFHPTNQEELSSLPELFLQRDKFFRELILESKTNLTGKKSLLAQLVAIRGLSTILEDHTETRMEVLIKSLRDFAIQLQVSLLEYLAVQTKDDKEAMMGLSFIMNNALIEGLRFGLIHYLNKMEGEK